MRDLAIMTCMAVALASCASAPLPSNVFTPQAVLAASKRLDGQEIAVRGWLGGCLPSEDRICGLYSSRRAAIGPRPKEWPLLIHLTDPMVSKRVREVVAHGRYVVNCRDTDTSICVDYDGYFEIDSIED